MKEGGGAPTAGNKGHSGQSCKAMERGGAGIVEGYPGERYLDLVLGKRESAWI